MPPQKVVLTKGIKQLHQTVSNERGENTTTVPTNEVKQPRHKSRVNIGSYGKRGCHLILGNKYQT